ncbi:dihydroorotate dehydrogenase electron transfer subunit [Lentibacillus saliphilus]|uniref:dihydroorotate dehydrogenase electron transfer subunit n=1 Tax=Lentibacillus saliphilus TaxID=2737028 RepID=UPI001FEB453F|nr:dihydroorotate dehydrogenase electron transfer subunit [Lentibacillus saliphilus]
MVQQQNDSSHKLVQNKMLQVCSVRSIAMDTFEMILSHPSVKDVHPGQFLNLVIDGHMLPRPISIADVDIEKGTLTILFKVIGAGTRKLSYCPSGSLIEAFGPIGNGFTLDARPNAHILLIGGGIGVPPLYYLGKTLKAEGHTITSILGFQSKDYVFYEAEFSELGRTIVVTDDGSQGQKGYVTSVLDDIPAFDRYYSCGPTAMLRSVSDALAETEGYLSLEERMACGVGACMACIISSQDGRYKKICSDGPVFSAKEVIL